MSAPAKPLPALLLKPSEEETLLRQSVAAIAAKYGADYFQAVTDKGEPPREFWKELAMGGFFGVHLPEEYGGGGGGLYELAAVIEEAAAGGVPPLSAVFSAGVNGTILAQHARLSRKSVGSGRCPNRRS